ncbi:Chromatin structure remodeling complex protein sfh1 [Ceratocystis pirilliformis]|uniref:Chromatin structure remodeling complex protein sfh1 n=1 Tax=Ceratocystis pirilliformis TaxID=259994 RepID=A0ABR3Z4C9_9PEZI
MTEQLQPQAFVSSYAPRLRTYNSSLLTPSLPSTTAVTGSSRTTKRGTTIINYAEDGYDDLDDDSDNPRRRGNALRSSRAQQQQLDDGTGGKDWSDVVGKETNIPVEVQPIWRDWTRHRAIRTDQQNVSQAALPLTLIPIRIDIDIPSYTPDRPFPVMPAMHEGLDMTLPQFRQQDPTPPYKLRDFFLWNLHETLITTDQFAQTLATDLDLPNRQQIVAEISRQIRTQLEEYAGVALHPLYRSQQIASASTQPPTQGRAVRGQSQLQNPSLAATPKVTANATMIAPEDDEFNPDDTYRCIISISLILSTVLYTDQFEWSLSHPPGTAELFAKQTCADLGLAGEWVPALTHAIYEAVLKLKKEACESNGWGAQQHNNDAAPDTIAGWRYDPEHLADAWEPKIEFLTKEEIEKREGDRERQLRRLRRETARFSNNTGSAVVVPFSGFGAVVEAEEERMGRGERTKKKRRFRSLSPSGRGTPDGGYALAMTDAERATWRCSHCRVWGSSVWAVRDGPAGAKTLCNNCGLCYERDSDLPRQMKNLHLSDARMT